MEYKKPRVLLLEDDNMLWPVIKEILEEHLGCTVTHFTNGSDGLRNYQTGDYDYIITDHNMPKMTGIQFLTVIREMGDQTPCLVQSMDKDYAKRSAERLGASYFKKPYNLTSFIAAVENLFKERPISPRNDAPEPPPPG